MSETLVALGGVLRPRVDQIEWLCLPPAGSGDGMSADALPPALLDAGLDSYEQLAWYRWIVGHQTVFGVWQMLSYSLRAASGGDPSFVADAVLCTNACAELFVYCATIPRNIYQDVIRTAMARHHPAFSGGWSTDHVEAASCHDQLIDSDIDSDMTAYMEARRNNRLVHKDVAGHLVPDDISLLQQHRAKPDSSSPDARTAGALFDSFFSTMRTDVTYRQVAEQTLRRLEGILSEIEDNDMNPWNELDSGTVGFESLRLREAETALRSQLEQFIFVVQRHTEYELGAYQC